MISAIVVMLLLAIVGLPMALWLDRDARGGGLIGLAFLIASGAASLLMLGMSVIAWRWSLIAVVSILIMIAGCAFLALRSHGASGRHDPLPTVGSVVLDGATLFCIIGHALYATLIAPWSWDFWAIWGLKAKIFLLRGGVDWEWLSRPLNDFAHPDYPPLLPLLFDLMLLPRGSYDDRWLGVVFVAFVLAGVGVIRDLLLRSTAKRSLASVGGLLAAGTLSSPWIGLAEIPLIAFTAAGLFYLRHGEKHGDSRAVSCAALLLGFGALTKNEGIAFVLSAAVATLVVYRRTPRVVISLWPAALIAGVWQLIRVTHQLHNDLFAGEVGARAVNKLQNVDDVFTAVVMHPPDRHLFWVLTLTIVLLGLRHVIRHERLLGSAIAVQACFYLGSYVVTPHDVSWHVSTSWSRLADQIALPLSILALLILFRRSDQPTEAPVAAAQ